MSIIKRGSVFYLRKRVPTRYFQVESRKIIMFSLHTDSESVAKTKAARAWQQMVEAWEARMVGHDQTADKLFESARELAAVRGFRYLDADAVAGLSNVEKIERIQAIDAPGGVPNAQEVTALMGTAPKPVITVKKALELYWDLAHDKTRGKSNDQLRRWRNPRIKAVKNFVKVVGDKAIDQISRDDMLDFHEWLSKKIDGGLTPNSANKDIVHLSSVLKTVNTMKRLGLELPLGDLAFKLGEQRTRPPFSVDWLKDKLLAPGALDGMNAEARGILLGMVNTGYRPSEGAALTSDTIRLDADVPHISIEANGRQLKSQYARRMIPLTGVSLEAFKAAPDGFPRYRSSPASLSATVNSYLRENGLLETPEHSFYSIRHSFEDRMLAAGLDDRIRRDLFGHALDRERYGKGATLEHLVGLIEPFAL